jgi:hypothetical protein
MCHKNYTIEFVYGKSFQQYNFLAVQRRVSAFSRIERINGMIHPLFVDPDFAACFPLLLTGSATCDGDERTPKYNPEKCVPVRHHRANPRVRRRAHTRVIRWGQSWGMTTGRTRTRVVPRSQSRGTTTSAHPCGTHKATSVRPHNPMVKPGHDHENPGRVL